MAFDQKLYSSLVRHPYFNNNPSNPRNWIEMTLNFRSLILKVVVDFYHKDSSPVWPAYIYLFNRGHNLYLAKEMLQI